jgi:hypothetical protein
VALSDVSVRAETRDVRPARASVGMLGLLILALVVFLPAAVYLPGLGFYSDDWNFLQVMAIDDGPPTYSWLLEPTARLFPIIDLRPAQAAYVGLRYSLFGRSRSATTWSTTW